MAKGSSNRFHGTRGNPQQLLDAPGSIAVIVAAAGDVTYMDSNDNFAKFIARRRDVDANGTFDVIAHGSPTSIEITHNGSKMLIDHRVAAKLIKHSTGYHGQEIRLLLCSTGKLDDGFAQNLANKLGVAVTAPTSILWARPSGTHYVADDDGHGRANRRKMGTFKTFYPQRRGSR
ncbi:hypothetical protein [Olsenella phocaeensis]|uniref:hypothetical protein n=1 Tax=Olsenella phocaeensis TaxID=1852385 RepID=UPI003A944000